MMCLDCLQEVRWLDVVHWKSESPASCAVPWQPVWREVGWINAADRRSRLREWKRNYLGWME